MITIDAERCNGCAACVDACPSGAIYLVEGKATVDASLCQNRETCLTACPTGAIALVVPDQPAFESAHPLSRPAESLRLQEAGSEAASDIIEVQETRALVSSRSRMLPALGAALGWAGREILPWLADLALDVLDRRESRSQRSNQGTCSGVPTTRQQGGGRQRRRRRRGG